MVVGQTFRRRVLKETSLSAFAWETGINKGLEERNPDLLDIERVIAETSFFLLAVCFVPPDLD